MLESELWILQLARDDVAEIGAYFVHVSSRTCRREAAAILGAIEQLGFLAISDCSTALLCSKDSNTKRECAVST